MYKFFTIFITGVLLSQLTLGQNDSFKDYEWSIVQTKGNAVGRHENAFIEYKGKFYLIGGRGIKPVNVFDPETNSWSSKNKTPFEMHHFQAVKYKNAIYVVGAMTGQYPKETPLENIYIYYPETDKWEKGPEIPEDRRRGSTGVVVKNDILYMIGGIQYGHTSGTCSWVDAYNLKTGEWVILPDAPNIRDHFFAVEADGKIYCIGGRNTSYHEPDNFTAFFSKTIREVDVYNIDQKKWHSLPEKLPVGTAAGGVALLNDKILYFGGESGQERAHSETQMLNPETGKWSLIAPLAAGRHGTGAITYNGNIYYAAGSGNRGGGNLNTLQVFSKDF